ncbi:MAG: transposase [Desulfobacterales bacterium]|nr:transposase [Desulfobacterales bacterium]
MTPLVIQLLENIQQQSELIQLLKDEIAILKGQKPKPPIKPSNLEKETNPKDSTKKKKKRKKKKSKTKNLEIDQEVILNPENIPHGSVLIDYKDYTIQDLHVFKWNITYRRARFRTPSGDFITADMPKDITSHFGPGLVTYILNQHYGCGVTQPLIIADLKDIGIEISTGQISNILIQNKEDFHSEKNQLLSTGLKMSGYIHVDDTGARHNGTNGYCTHIGNEYFAWFESSASKSRINFLNILRGDNKDYILNEDALEYMVVQKLPQYQLNKLIQIKNRIFETNTEWDKFLMLAGITSPQHVRIATEGALVGSIISHGFNKNLAIISDDAGQFNVFLHGLCWVHAERTIHKLVGFTDEHKKILEETRKDIWELYRDLKKYRLDPDNAKKKDLETKFDELFTRKTNFATLNQALKRIHMNKSELLLVLERPDIPLHNNLSENDIREYVKKRKISGSTRSDNGKKSRDTFTSLKKTCRKLRISFRDYIYDRISKENSIPHLPDVMMARIVEAKA